MNEETVIRYMPLPPGTRPWRWHADANLIILCSSLDEAGREAALTDLQAQWRREGLRVVPDEIADCPVTVPVKRLPASLLAAER